MTTAKIEVEIEFDGEICNPQCQLMIAEDWQGDRWICILDGELLQTKSKNGVLECLRCVRCKKEAK